MAEKTLWVKDSMFVNKWNIMSLAQAKALLEGIERYGNTDKVSLLGVHYSYAILMYLLENLEIMGIDVEYDIYQVARLYRNRYADFGFEHLDN